MCACKREFCTCMHVTRDAMCLSDAVDCVERPADSAFCRVMAPQSPFLVSQGTYATFRNCLFHSVHLPATHLLDVSHFGTVTLVDTLFANTSLPLGVVGTDAASCSISTDESANDTAHGGVHRPAAEPPGRAVAAEELVMRFSPASDEDAALFGAQFVADDETVSDCGGGRRRGVTLPGCPAAAEWAAAPSPTAWTAESAHGGLRGWAEASHRQEVVEATAIDRVGPPAGAAVPAVDGVETGSGPHAVHAACWGSGLGGGVDGGGLGFCMAGHWQLVERGYELSVEHPWLTALSEVCTPRSRVPHASCRLQPVTECVILHLQHVRKAHCRIHRGCTCVSICIHLYHQP